MIFGPNTVFSDIFYLITKYNCMFFLCILEIGTNVRPNYSNLSVLSLIAHKPSKLSILISFLSYSPNKSIISVVCKEILTENEHSVRS